MSAMSCRLVQGVPSPIDPRDPEHNKRVMKMNKLIN